MTTLEQADIPRVDYALIGGAVLRGMRFPEDLDSPDVEVLERGLVFRTPYGETAPFKLLRWRATPELGGGERLGLYMRYLASRSGATRTADAEAAFWVLEQAGVRRILTDDNMGSLNPLLEPGDLVVCHDFIDLHKQASVAPLEGKLVRMRAPYCPELRALLHGRALAEGFSRVFRRGVYAVSHGTRFESPAEIQMYRQLGGDIVGYSLVPHIYLARAIGACYGGIYLIANFGEGLIEDWDHEVVWDVTDRAMPAIGRIMLESARRLSPATCGCASSVSPRPRGSMEYGDR